MRTLEELVEEWLDRQTHLRPRTRIGYETALRRHVLPRIGKRRLVDLGEGDILLVIKGMQDKGLAEWTIRGALTPLGPCFPTPPGAG